MNEAQGEMTHDTWRTYSLIPTNGGLLPAFQPPESPKWGTIDHLKVSCKMGEGAKNKEMK